MKNRRPKEGHSWKSSSPKTADSPARSLPDENHRLTNGVIPPLRAPTGWETRTRPEQRNGQPEPRHSSKGTEAWGRYSRGQLIAGQVIPGVETEDTREVRGIYKSIRNLAFKYGVSKPGRGRSNERSYRIRSSLLEHNSRDRSAARAVDPHLTFIWLSTWYPAPALGRVWSWRSY